MGLKREASLQKIVGFSWRIETEIQEARAKYHWDTAEMPRAWLLVRWSMQCQSQMREGRRSAKKLHNTTLTFKTLTEQPGQSLSFSLSLSLSGWNWTNWDDASFCKRLSLVQTFSSNFAKSFTRKISSEVFPATAKAPNGTKQWPDASKQRLSRAMAQRKALPRIIWKFFKALVNKRICFY